MNITSFAPAASIERRGPWLAWPQLVFLLSLVALVRADRLLGDPDSHWHVAAGRWIVSHGRVFDTDPFSHSMPGAAWVAQSWLSEVLMALVHQAGGWPALAVVAVVSWGLALAVLTRFLVDRMEPVHALLFVGLAAALSTTHLLVRPHVFVMPVLVVWVAALVEANERRAAPPWRLLGLMVLWANLHGSFTFGLALAAPLCLEAVLQAAPAARRATALRWGAFLLLSIGASMLTPQGWHGLTYTVYAMQQGIALTFIGEWQSPNFRAGNPMEYWLLLVLGIALTGRVRFPWLRILMLLGLTHLALKHMRSISLLGLVSPLLMATPLARSWYAGAKLGQDAAGLDRWFRVPAGPSLATGWLWVGVATLAVAGFAVQRDTIRPMAERIPAAALAAARSAGITHTPVYNSYNFGGYLIYEGVPVYVDGRSDMYGDAFLREMKQAAMPEKSETLVRHLDRYRIGWTLLEPKSTAAVLLDHLPGWQRVYADKIATVHVRKTAP